VTFKRASCLIVAVVCLLVTLPLVPSVIAGFSGFGRMAASGKSDGYVTVEGCDRGALIVNWQCHGSYTKTDTQPAAVFPNVTVANGYHHYAVGERVQANLKLGTHNAYRSGVLITLATIGLALLVLYELSVVLVIAFLSLRKEPVSVLGPALVAVLTALTVYAA
jgi:hypothetical protein